MSYILKDENSNDQDKIDSNVSILNNSSNLFSNSYHTFIVRKSERLASALYVITGFMPADEPVRSRLRVCALELITRSSSPSELAETGREKFESRCTEIVTILQTANYAGLISGMNAKLIGEEYAALSAFVRTHSGRISERGHELSKVSISEPKSVAGSIRHSNKSLLKSEAGFKRTESKIKSVDIGDRKSIILDIINKKPEVSIKDVVSFIPGVSEKTVQRDLLALVASGILVKKGSRRWTTYARPA